MLPPQPASPRADAAGQDEPVPKAPGMPSPLCAWRTPTRPTCGLAVLPGRPRSPISHSTRRRCRHRHGRCRRPGCVCRASAPAAINPATAATPIGAASAVLSRHSRASRGAATKATASSASDAGRTGMSSMAAWARAEPGERGDRDTRPRRTGCGPWARATGRMPPSAAASSNANWNSASEPAAKPTAASPSDAITAAAAPSARSGGARSIQAMTTRPASAQATLRGYPPPPSHQDDRDPGEAQAEPLQEAAAHDGVERDAHDAAPARISRVASASRRRVASASP